MTRYLEISTSVAAQVRSRQLLPGDEVPAVRVLAARMGVTPSTVGRGYAYLEQAGVLAVEPRRRTRVAPEGYIAALRLLHGERTFRLAGSDDRALADLAVLGTVERTKAVDHGLLTELLVERTAKGRHRTNMTIHQDAAVTPLYDFGSPCAQLGVNDAYPPLLVGDRAVLLLEKSGDGYVIQPWSGEFRSEAGRVASPRLNQFHDIDGCTEAQLMDHISAI